MVDPPIPPQRPGRPIRQISETVCRVIVVFFALPTNNNTNPGTRPNGRTTNGNRTNNTDDTQAPGFTVPLLANGRIPSALALFNKEDGCCKDVREILTQYWRYCLLALSALVILGIRHLTGGYWMLPVRIVSPIYVFLLVEIFTELFGLRFNRVLWLLSSVWHMFWYFSYAKDTYLVNYIELPVSLMAIAFFSLCMSDCNRSGEKFIVYALVVIVLLGSFGFNKVANHPCLPCASHLPAIVRDYLVPKLVPNAKAGHLPGAGRSFMQRYSTGISAWLLLLESESPVPKECGICYTRLTKYAVFTTDALRNYRLDEYDFIREKLIESGLYDYVRIIGNNFEELNGNKDVCLKDFDHSLSSTNLRLMDEWYDDLRAKHFNNTSGKRFIDALVMGVSTEDGREMLGSVVKEFLCSPSSRVGPPPSDFLHNLERPRFTGESPGMVKPMNITLDKIRDIMRSSILNGLGPDVCFLVRLANVIPEDPDVLEDNLNPSRVAPVLNEQDLKGDEASFLYPALYVPRTDEDNDKDGVLGQTFEALLTLYQQLPMRDGEPTFFESKEEYLAFFRWNVEHTLQDEYYFPKWISRAASKGQHEENGGNETEYLYQQLSHETGKLIADQFKHMSEMVTLTNSTSDETLSDRAFFGTGMKNMVRIKLPGDDDYGYVHPVGPDYFESAAHSDFFRNNKMPTTEELESMGRQFWKDGNDVPLEDFKQRVVQVDYTISSHWQHREPFEEQGSILFLDAETRKPMGIFVTAMGRIVLPTEARRWEYAKFYHRSSELQVMALRHVAEYHIGWANTFSTAIRQTLPQNHGLRAFLKPYAHATGQVNWIAYQMLLLDNSILHRASGLARRARGYCFGHIQKLLNFTKTLPMVLEEKKLDGMSNLTKDIPLFTNGMRLWNVHRNFTEGYINLLYPDDESLFSDPELYRFWHHVNTLGRHTDPCVCGMHDDAFYKSDSWPAFEQTRTCRGLLDHQRFLTGADEVQRRQQWCKRHPIENLRALHSWLEDDCKADAKCRNVSPPGLSYDFYHMRANMGLPALNRQVLINVITMFINEATVGHEMAADNIPFMVDPEYGGVRMPRQGPDDKRPLMVDVSTYVFGTVISALTTIRSNPLLSDWSNLLVHWIDNVDHDKAVPSKKAIRKLHLKYKTDLIKLSNDFLKGALSMPKNRWAPYLNPATQASSVAV